MQGALSPRDAAEGAASPPPFWLWSVRRSGAWAVGFVATAASGVSLEHRYRVLGSWETLNTDSGRALLAPAAAVEVLDFVPPFELH